MDSRLLEYVVAVADELSFTRASTRLRTTQSTISAGVRAIERELGVELFARSTRSVSLTPAGRLLVADARSAVEAVERLRDDAHATSRGLRGRVRMGTFPSMTLIDLPALLGDYHRRHPEVEVELVESDRGTTGLATDVQSGRLDAALSGLPAADHPGLHLTHLVSTSFVAVLPQDHALVVDARPVPLERLADDRFIDAPRGFGNRIVLDRELAARGVHRRVALEVSDMGAIASFVAAGLGVAIIPAGLSRAAEGTVVRAIAGAPIEWSLSLVTRPLTHASRALAALVDLVEHSVVEHGVVKHRSVE